MNITEEESSAIPESTIISTKMGVCEVCGDSVAKYTCPRCEVKTCCLGCLKIHKEELDCSGIRDKTKFIPLNKFTNLDLSSDYRLLEEISRTVEGLKRNRGKIQRQGREHLPHHLHLLYKAAISRKTILKFLPKNFERHKKNTTCLNQKGNVLFWHIDWFFVNADNLQLSDKVPETAKLCNLLHKYLIKQEDRVLQDKLQYYQAADLPGIKIFLKAEQKPGCKYYELDPLATLKDNLKNKTIIENPIIHLVLKENTTSYNIIDSDDEIEQEEVGNGKEVVNRIIKKAEKEDTVDNSLKNLLFISEQSDGDSSDDN